MKTRQHGFTLIEIAIVLVIIGLLLGGILKGQELINSAKVKNLATDFKNIPLYLYGYQDKFRALPGDDVNVATHITGGTLATTPAAGDTRGNGVVGGLWNTATNTDESCVFWQHVRLAGFAPGPTATVDCATAASTYLPRNSEGGRIGIQTNNATFVTITAPTAMTGTYVICSEAILGKYAKQLDTTLDDGETSTGSLRVTDGAPAGTAETTATIVDGTSYTVCMGI